MMNIHNSFEFKDNSKKEYEEELQNTLDRLEQLVLHAGQFHNEDDCSLWEYAREERADNLAYVIINLITVSKSLEEIDYDRINELIYALEENNRQ